MLQNLSSCKSHLLDIFEILEFPDIISTLTEKKIKLNALPNIFSMSSSYGYDFQFDFLMIMLIEIVFLDNLILTYYQMKKGYYI